MPHGSSCPDPASTAFPLVSVVVPCRNEAAHIGALVDGIVRSDYPRERLEVFIVDGMSTDGTRELLTKAAAEHPFIRVLDNPGLIAPRALNIGAALSRGDVIVRMDAHSQYPPDYIRRCVRLLQRTGAGCAGGRVEFVPNGQTAWARAVAAVTRHRLGVGTSFRNRLAPGFVDTVPDGAFPRAALQSVGLWDERLTRNQDNELTARLRHKGYKVAFHPRIRKRYLNQATLSGLLRQGFHTGMWNVYALVLCPYTWAWRHFVPGAFVLYLALAPAAGGLAGGWRAAALFPLALYAALVALVSARLGRSAGGAWRAASTMFLYHAAYGAGLHAGAANVLVGRWRDHLGKPLDGGRAAPGRLAGLAVAACALAAALGGSPARAAFEDSFAGQAQSPSSIQWTWTSSAAAQGYRVMRGAANLSGDTASDAWLETGLATNTAYGVYHAQAFNAYGVTDSTTASRCTLAAVPAGLEITGVSWNFVKMAWTANGNPSGTTYQVWRADSPSGPWTLRKQFSTPPLIFTCGSVRPSSTYYYAVRALNRDGVPTDFGNIVSATTLAYPPAQPPAAQPGLDGARVYPNPYEPDSGNADEGKPFDPSDPDSGIIFDRLVAGASVKIYDAAGRLVAELSAGSGGRAQWDVKNGQGRAAASGYYFAVLSGAGQGKVVRSFMIVR